MSERDEYILTTRTEEIARLGVQHEVWAVEAATIFAHAGFAPGDVVLDLGSGPGFTSIDLARIVGHSGKIIARDKSRHFLDFLSDETRRLHLPQIEVSEGPVEALDIAAESLDGAYARWLFCWLADPAEVLERVTRALRPGGAIALQEYLDWGAMKLVPESTPFDRAVEACMSSWTAGGVTIDFAERVPSLAATLGLEIELFHPIARLGRVGAAGSATDSPEWRWVSGFLDSYLPGLVEQGLLTQPELDAYRGDRAERIEEGVTYLFPPIMADVVLRKPVAE